MERTAVETGEPGMQLLRWPRYTFIVIEIIPQSVSVSRIQIGIGNIRFDKLMPDDVDTLERAEREDWDDARLAEALGGEEEHVVHWRRSYQRAKSIVDAPTPAESFRHGVRFSIEDAVRDGLADEKQIEDLVTQICYRAADLAYLLDMGGERLSDYSRELRATSGGGFAPLISTNDTN